MSATSRSSNTDTSTSASLFVQQDDHYDNEHIVSRRRLTSPPQHEPARYPGDGLDFRRPVMSRPPDTFIDLTADDNNEESARRTQESSRASSRVAAEVQPARAQRLPRYERDIISIVSDGEEESNNMTSSHFTETHPQYGVLRRPLRDEQNRTFDTDHARSQRHNSPRAHIPRSITPHPSNIENPIDLTGDDDNDIILLDTRPIGGVNLHRPDAGIRDLRHLHLPHPLETARRPSMVAERLRRRLGTVLTDDEQRRLEQLGLFGNGERGQRGLAHHIQGAQNLVSMGFNVVLDYTRPAFDLGIVGGNRPPSPKYEPPPKPASGFTRNPAEDEVVVCPNCGDELATGQSDLKQEIYVIKACGHVSVLFKSSNPTSHLLISRQAYCGVCALSGVKKKGTTSSGKGKGKARAVDEPSNGLPPMKTCVVDDCKSKVTQSLIIRIYSS